MENKRMDDQSKEDIEGHVVPVTTITNVKS